MPNVSYLILAVAVSFAIGGCDVFHNTTTTVVGAVTNAHTGAPIAGINVILADDVSWGTCGTPAVSITDTQGRYEVSIAPNRRRDVTYVILMANTSCFGLTEHDDNWTTYFQSSIQQGKTYHIAIQLSPRIPAGETR